jgi:hypothetical protein
LAKSIQPGIRATNSRINASNPWINAANPDQRRTFSLITIMPKSAFAWRLSVAVSIDSLFSICLWLASEKIDKLFAKNSAT